VVEASDEIIRKAIVREIQRGGQVFFVHNRVESIELVADRLRQLLPELRFDVAHGQMAERDLEKVMLDFLERRSDVLVSTMIVESGLDLPNVNTILVHRADALGLAQLYQLRGRVGRSNHRAYAYLLIPEGQSLSDVARKRLRAIEEFSELGAGFRLAMRDMEIRGVGNFLGPEQSGHVNAIGYDLYCQLLRESVAEMRGAEAPSERTVVRMDVELDAYLPGAYVEDPDQRIGFYKRLADLDELGDLRGMVEELRDRYGRLSEPARNLVLLKEMQLLAEAGCIEQVKVRSREAWFGFCEGEGPGRSALEKLVQSVPGELSFQADGREGLRIRLEVSEGQDAVEAARVLLRAVCASDTVSVS
jgi:transcription-repair coupling factor (superfamily II helicase)